MTVEKKPRKEKTPPQGEAKSLIDQIDGIKLPTRQDPRRAIYLGEELRCILKTPTVETKAEIIDMSCKGLALAIPKSNMRLDPIVGQKVELEFFSPKIDLKKKQSYSINGTISHCASMVLGKKNYLRVGIQFHLQKYSQRADFLASIPHIFYETATAIRPQASCKDAFFYEEHLFFDMHAITSQGCELRFSTQIKSILPGQKLQLDVFIPGRGIYFVQVKNSQRLLQIHEHYIIYVEFENTSQEFKEALSEYLVNSSKNFSPNLIRKDAFHLGNLDHITTVQQQDLSIEEIKQEFLEPKYFGTQLEADAKSPSFQGRHFVCKIGPHCVASFGIHFNGEEHPSLFVKSGHQLPEENPHAEFVYFLCNQKASLVDYFVLMIKQVIRIVAQNKIRYLYLEAQSEMIEVLKRLGFIETPSHIDHQGKTHRLMQCDVKELLSSQQKILPQRIWLKLYKNLADYLKLI